MIATIITMVISTVTSATSASVTVAVACGMRLGSSFLIAVLVARELALPDESSRGRGSAVGKALLPPVLGSLTIFGLVVLAKIIPIL